MHPNFLPRTYLLKGGVQVLLKGGVQYNKSFKINPSSGFGSTV